MDQGPYKQAAYLACGFVALFADGYHQAGHHGSSNAADRGRRQTRATRVQPSQRFSQHDSGLEQWDARALVDQDVHDCSCQESKSLSVTALTQEHSSQ